MSLFTDTTKHIVMSTAEELTVVIYEIWNSSHVSERLDVHITKHTPLHFSADIFPIFAQRSDGYP